MHACFTWCLHVKTYILIFTLCKTFKWIKLLVVESQKDGLQIPVKISLGKWLWDTQELLKVYEKCKFLTIRCQLFRFIGSTYVHTLACATRSWLDLYYVLDLYYTEPIIRNFLTLFAVKGSSKADLLCFCHHSSHIKQTFLFVYTTSDVHRQQSMVEYHKSVTLFQHIWSPLHLNQKRLSHL